MNRVQTLEVRFSMLVLAALAVFGVRLASAAEAPPPQSRAESNAPQGAANDRSGMRKITIRGVCVDEHGAPIAEARVRVFRYPSRLDAPLLVADLRANGDGKFLAEEIATAIDETDFASTGDVCVAATADGRVSSIRWV
ncbi:MAG: hypothetical protein ACREHD_14895, partial [Pirellulales bacterium]